MCVGLSPNEGAPPCPVEIAVFINPKALHLTAPGNDGDTDPVGQIKYGVIGIAIIYQTA